MFAKLFDQISVRSLANALLFAMALLLAAFWLPSLPLHFTAGNQNFLLQPQAVWPLAFSTLLLSAFIFNEVNNRQRLFEGNYHLLSVLVALAFCAFAGNQWPKGYYQMPFLLLFVLRVYKLVYEGDSKYLFFEVGTISGLLSFWYSDYLALLPISWILGLIAGKLSLRNIMASLLGALALIYLPIAVGGMIDYPLWKVFSTNLQSQDFSFQYDVISGSFTFFLMLLLLLAVLFQFPSLNSRANNMQRQAISLWYVLLLISVSGYLLLEHKEFWLALTLFPFARLLALFIASNKNKWLRNGVYFLLIAGAVLTYLTRFGIILT